MTRGIYKIQGTTRDEIGSHEVGCGNFFQGDYKLPDGTSKTGLTCLISLNDRQVTVGLGSQIDFGDFLVEVIEIERGPHAERGLVTFKEILPFDHQEKKSVNKQQISSLEKLIEDQFKYFTNTVVTPSSFEGDLYPFEWVNHVIQKLIPKEPAEALNYCLATLKVISKNLGTPLEDNGIRVLQAFPSLHFGQSLHDFLKSNWNNLSLEPCSIQGTSGQNRRDALLVALLQNEGFKNIKDDFALTKAKESLEAGNGPQFIYPIAKFDASWMEAHLDVFLEKYPDWVANAFDVMVHYLKKPALSVAKHLLNEVKNDAKLTDRLWDSIEYSAKHSLLPEDQKKELQDFVLQKKGPEPKTISIEEILNRLKSGSFYLASLPAMQSSSFFMFFADPVFIQWSWDFNQTPEVSSVFIFNEDKLNDYFSSQTKIRSFNEADLKEMNQLSAEHQKAAEYTQKSLEIFKQIEERKNNVSYKYVGKKLELDWWLLYHPHWGWDLISTSDDKVKTYSSPNGAYSREQALGWLINYFFSTAGDAPVKSSKLVEDFLSHWKPN